MLSRRCWTVLAVLAISICAYSQYGIYTSRGLLEKKIYYIDENGKTGTCGFWSMNLGKHSHKLKKAYPGEGEVSVDAEMNYNFLSSLYIEGKGYSDRGIMKSDATFAVPDGEGIKEAEPEKIIYVYDYGAKANISEVGKTDFILLVQDNQLTIKRMLLRIFNYNKQYKELKFSKDVAIKAFAFSKAGLQEAIRAQKEVE